MTRFNQGCSATLLYTLKNQMQTSEQIKSSVGNQFIQQVNSVFWELVINDTAMEVTMYLCKKIKRNRNGFITALNNFVN